MASSKRDQIAPEGTVRGRTSNADDKRSSGRYYTAISPFSHPEFRAWCDRAGLPAALLVEPFAGAGGIVDMLRHEGLADRVAAFDILPAAPYVEKRDCFTDYPALEGVVVTNPPYMARNSAKRRGLPFPKTEHNDAYLHSLDLMLGASGFVGAIVPASFARLDLFRDRLTHLIDLPIRGLFVDTDHPVCLALFEPESAGAQMWSWARRLGSEHELRAAVPDLPDPARISFNEPRGAIGLRAVDRTVGPTIEFVVGSDIEPDAVKPSSRLVTRLDIEGLKPAEVGSLVQAANVQLARIRSMSEDVVLLPFKGIRGDGEFRRRLDYRLARIVLSIALEKIELS